MGRNAKPINLLVAQGKKHLTKAEIDKRRKAEIKLGNNKLLCPNYIKSNVNAYKKWKQIIKIYKEVDFVSSVPKTLHFFGVLCATYLLITYCSFISIIMFIALR